jgi:hypothetical protein
MLRKSLAAGLAAVAALAAAGAAHAACSAGDRPGTPSNLRVAPAKGKTDTLRAIWTGNTRGVLFHDIEVTDLGGRVVQSLNGAPPSARPKGTALNNDFARDFPGLGPNETRCFRVRARTLQGTQGCVSPNWTDRICGTTARPNQKWGALAADDKGAWGHAVNYATESQARDAAMRFCGNARCAVKVAGPVACYAYFESRAGGYRYGLALDSSLATAVRVARGGCEKSAPAGTCKLVKSKCGL